VRRLFLALIVVCGLALAGPSVAGDPAALKVKLETSRQLYEPGDTVEITLTNQRGAPIFLPGCGALQLEMFEADAYVPVPVEKCVSEGEAQKVEPGETTLSFAPGNTRSGQILRIAVAFGWGCEEARPLSQARCDDFGTVWTSNFRVGKGGKSE